MLKYKILMEISDGNSLSFVSAYLHLIFFVKSIFSFPLWFISIFFHVILALQNLYTVIEFAFPLIDTFSFLTNYIFISMFSLKFHAVFYFFILFSEHCLFNSLLLISPMIVILTIAICEIFLIFFHHLLFYAILTFFITII